MNVKKNRDVDLILASKYYEVNSSGELERLSFPFESRYRTVGKVGVGFDTCRDRYFEFSHQHKPKGSRFILKSHRMIFFKVFGWLPGEVDHIDNNTKNNHPSNLRPATRSENCRNVRSAKGSASKYLGVSWHKRDEKWTAQVYANDKLRHLGYFTDEKEAAESYDKAALEYFGDFANLNFK